MRPEEQAARLERAWQERKPIEPLSSEPGIEDVVLAYRIQQAWVQGRLAGGDRVVGHKIGLTSRAMQEQLGVGEPDYGTLLQGMEVPLSRGQGEMEAGRLIQPRAEGEIAFLLGEALEGPGVSVLDVFRATAAVAAAVEIVDSRIRDWRITLVDTVADDASSGAFAIGAWRQEWHTLDLALAGMVLYVDGAAASIGAGAAALGHPATCVAWLANKLGSMGQRLEAGEVVLSGALAASVPVRAANAVRLEVEGLSPLTVRFT
ncbi:2-keto-4-pentenoate hydratase [Limnochorda pilosa]|uniref:2-hydroxypenta-2,4-dienoate hydratase n=1 Tax=Limnochorda pilosa TaxID=1555112 RepID=A0A0K2SLL4_LIMPI|nr:fumarylacetoacetate hydrolase family protein [Limnochorda pilosa]BAS28008.1 2-hydroxypenta-2,4-dienoate hydratase [Limnochorda pilosa]